MDLTDTIRKLPESENRMVVLLLGALLFGGCGNQGDRSFEPGPPVEDPGWPTYAGLEAGTRYSPLNQINRSNAGDLEIAWTYNTGHLDRAPHFNVLLGFQATPILLPEEAGRHLVLCDPYNRIIALDPATGRERWAFDPEINLSPHAGRFNCRGVTYWRDPDAAQADSCAHRILLATNDRRLAAVDARNGESCRDFGDNGFVDVTPIIQQLRPTSQLLTMQLTSPVAVVNGVIIIGATADERFRAYDTLTGELLWEFDGPTSANATPMTYMADGRQFVVVATGGHSWVYPFRKGDAVVAYSLPD